MRRATNVIPLHRSLLAVTRVRVRLPEGICQAYMQWAAQMPVLSERRHRRRQVLMELALQDGLRRLWAGESLAACHHPMRTYSLLLHEWLLNQIQLTAEARKEKCGALVASALTEYLQRCAPEHYRKLKVGAATSVHGMRIASNSGY